MVLKRKCTTRGKQSKGKKSKQKCPLQGTEQKLLSMHTE